MARLLQLLVQANALGRAQAEEARQMQIVYGDRIGTNLLARGLVRETMLAQALGSLHGVPYAAGSEADSSPTITRGLHRNVAMALRAVPARVDEHHAWVFMIDPQDAGIVQEVAHQLQKPVQPVVVCEARMWQLLHKFYMAKKPSRVLQLDGPPAQPRQKILPRSQTRNAPSFVAELDDPSTAFQQISSGSDLDDPTSSSVGLLSWLSTLPEGPAASQPQWKMQASPFDHEVVDLTELAPVEEPPPLVHGTLVEEKPPRDASPISFEAAKALLANAVDRDAIALIVLRSCLSVFKRALLLTVQRGFALGWDGLGEGIDDVDRVRIPLTDPSIFKLARDSKAHFLGPLPKERDNILFLKQTGGVIPRSALLVPIVVRGKVVNLLYCDNGRGEHVSTDIGEMLVVAQHINRSYEALLKRR